LPVFEARKLLERKIIGCSTHNLEQVSVADTLPVNYIAIGPVFPTSTKRGAGRMLGLSIVAEARIRTKRPLICIGGIQMHHFRELLSAGADGVAFISELYKPPGLQKNIYRLLEEIDACRS
jgi:thiamine-phosphate pyrophosphorylase